MAVDGYGGNRAEPLDDLPHQLPELGRDRVSDGVGDIERACACLDRGLVQLHQEVDVRARRILRTELDLRKAAQGLAAIAHPLRGGKERVVTGDAQLVLEVDVAAGDEDVEVRPFGHPKSLDGPLRIAVLAAGQAGHGHAPGFLGNLVDRLEFAG